LDACSESAILLLHNTPVGKDIGQIDINISDRIGPDYGDLRHLWYIGFQFSIDMAENPRKLYHVYLL
jgi:hypothetical protein